MLPLLTEIVRGVITGFYVLASDFSRQLSSEENFCERQPKYELARLGLQVALAERAVAQ